MVGFGRSKSDLEGKNGVSLRESNGGSLHKRHHGAWVVQLSVSIGGRCPDLPQRSQVSPCFGSKLEMNLSMISANSIHLPPQREEKT